MRPPTRNDGPVPTLRKHPPPVLVPTSSSQQHQSAQLNGAAAAATGTTDAIRINDRGRRAYFDVETDHLLCYASPTAANVQRSARPPGIDASALHRVSYERRPSGSSDTEDLYPQVSLNSAPPPADGDHTVVGDNSDDDDNDVSGVGEDGNSGGNASSPCMISSDDSSSANCMLYADIAEQQPLWSAPDGRPNGGHPAANVARNGRTTGSSASVAAGAAGGQKRAGTDSAALGQCSAESGRVALVKNSASLIFTKKPPMTVAPAAVAQQHPVVHRRQQQQQQHQRTAIGVRPPDQRHSLHDHQSENCSAVRSERASSWYAPLYMPLREEDGYRLLQVCASDDDRWFDHEFRTRMYPIRWISPM